ncbi:MAG: hypothetical protein NC548_58830 [Lachnospiraceae bacterium]|nr:hypothetical protein [Lachnospiraceae bacterium]
MIWIDFCLKTFTLIFDYAIFETGFARAFSSRQQQYHKDSVLGGGVGFGAAADS